SLCLLLSRASHAPRMLVLTEGGLAAVTREWDVDDIVLASAAPAELDARIRLVTQSPTRERHITAAGITIDEASYAARLDGRALDLTYKEFELLRFFASHPGRVYTREQLLSEVWGEDYFGGTRTVDVHV